MVVLLYHQTACHCGHRTTSWFFLPIILRTDSVLSRAQMQAIQAAAEMEVKLKLAEDKVEDLEHQLQEKSGMHEDADKSVDILKNRLEQKVGFICG